MFLDIHNVLATYDKVTGVVVDIYSDVFNSPPDNDTQSTIIIKTGEGDEFVHVQGDYPVYDENGCHNYKVINEELMLRSQAEKDMELINLKLISDAKGLMSG